MNALISRNAALLFVSTGLLAAACGSTSAAASSAKQVIAPPGEEFTCPVTQPPKTRFVPPEPWPAQPPGEDRFWYGESGLWTALPVSGSWAQLARGEKFWWWSEEFDVSEDTTPDLTLTASRLDGDAAVFTTNEATNGYHESFHWAMLAGVDLPSTGCWEFTGRYNGYELSLVIWVPEE
jgi:hypothetical protein